MICGGVIAVLPKPEMVKGNPADFASVSAERMDIAISNSPEILEIDTQFECRVCRLHEVGLIDAELFDKMAEMGQSRLAHANNSNLFRFNENNVIAAKCQSRPPANQPPNNNAVGM